MKHLVQAIDLKKSCSLYSSSVQQTLRDLLNIKVNNGSSAESVSQLENREDLYFSILFTGQIYGEFLFGLSKATALKMLGIDCEATEVEQMYWKNRSEILDSFKEVINIAAGTTLAEFKSVFPELSITPPKAIEGHITLSSYDIGKVKLDHPGGSLSCYIYIDYMKLEIRNTIERDKKQIEEERAKQEELKRLNRAKSEFLSNMSHELRTPLNGIIGMLDILKGSTLSSIQKEQFDVIYRSGEFLLTLISDILEFSKIESGKLEIENKSFDLRKSIDSIAESLAAVVLGKGLDFNVQMDPSLSGRFLGDETRIKQVLVNLVGNAVKFTPTGAISILVNRTSDAKIEMQVHDTGIGIPAAKLNSIFGSFSQVDVSDNRKYGGTGLGLAISKAIVVAMGGDICVESTEAVGSKFTVRFPLAKDPSESTGVAATPITLGPVRVLTLSDVLFETIGLYTQSLSAKKHIERLVDLEAVQAQSDDIFLIEYKAWQRIRPDLIRRFLDEVISKNAYVVFMTLAKDLESLQANKDLQQLKRFHFMNYPVLSGRLAEVLSHKPNFISEEASKESFCQINPAPSTAKGKVLVVEDNLVNQVVIATMLKQLGYEVDIVDNGQKAVDLMSVKHEYQLIFMDCQMPVMNGYEATAAIRKLEQGKTARTPIIALTADAFRETKEDCFACGMDDFATKPLKFEVLKSVIKRSLDKLPS